MRLACTLLSYLGLVGWLILPAVLVERRRLRAKTAEATERERRAAVREAKAVALEARLLRAYERLAAALERSLAKAEGSGPALPGGD